MLAAVEAQTGGEQLPAEEAYDYADLTRLRKQFSDFLSLKTEENREQRQSRLYYHGSHWTADQLRELKRRGQPPTTTPIFARKVNGFVGLVEKLRQDPKAYPRTPKEEMGAELCTAALRYALDEQEWQAKSPIVTLNGAVDAIGGIELSLIKGDTNILGDYDISIETVEPEYFFYDPRSFRHDFSDARFMGMSKWRDVDEVKADYPDKSEEIDALSSFSGSEFEIDSDRRVKWFNSELKQVLQVEHWYKRGNKWLWCIYIGTVELDKGRTYLFDEKGKDECRFVMWSGFVDQDGDRYAFFRNMKSLIDEINQRNSKALHLLAMRRVKMEEGAVQDVEEMRRESVRPDGVIVINKGYELEFEDAKSLADMKGQLEMKQAAATELENFGPNPALVGQGVQSKSGRAIALLQQAGLAELGPFIIAYRGWKIRVYRAVWNAIKRYWKAERWIRVTDANGEQQQVQVNGVEVDPVTQMQQMVNQLGALDVDIIIDEGPDAVNMQADALEVLQTASSQGTQIPPQVMIELLPLPDSMKKKLLGLIQQAQQPSPAQQQAAQTELEQGQANVDKTRADTALALSKSGESHASGVHKMALAQSEASGRNAQQPDQPDPGMSAPEMIEKLASAQDKRASAALKWAQVDKTRVDTRLAPVELAQRANADQARLKAMQNRPSAS